MTTGERNYPTISLYNTSQNYRFEFQGGGTPGKTDLVALSIPNNVIGRWCCPTLSAGSTRTG